MNFSKKFQKLSMQFLYIIKLDEHMKQTLTHKIRMIGQREEMSCLISFGLSQIYKKQNRYYNLFL
jgi:hypothetical protein